MKALAPLLAALALSAVARPDGGNEHHFRVPLASPLATQTKPYRELVWGDVNILHTTDIHGWLLGHQKLSPPEPNYSGTFGDFASFVSRMNTTAEHNGYDLLLVDTGDLRDGTGLSDGHPKGQWAGEETDKFFLRLPYDVMTIGNHELYAPPTIAYDIHANLSKKTKRYLTSNAFIHITSDSGVNKTVPIGWQFAKFKTLRKKLNVTAFGVTFNATGFSPNVSVQPAEIMVQQPWFQDAIKEQPSFFLLTGHMSVGAQNDDWRAVVKPIRELHKDTPIIILGGHTHTRNCTQFDDDKVVALESGSYMDTVGWLSFNLSNTGKPLQYSRRYLDPNRVTYKYHTHAQTDKDFDTHEGKKITKDLWKLYRNFNLSHIWGESPHDYTYYRVPVSNNTAQNLFVGEALPTLLNSVPCSGSNQRQKFYFIDSGVLRYDIYAGEFDQNDQLTAAPYADGLLCIPNVPLADAMKAADNMNKPHDAGSNGQAYSPVDLREARRRETEKVDMIHRNWLLQMSEQHADQELPEQEGLTLGYVTTDQCGTKESGDGDDVKHIPIKVVDHWQRIVTGPSGVSDALVDLVILNHGWSDVLRNLNASSTSRKYYESDIDENFTNLTTNEVLGKYAQTMWSQK